MHAKRLTFFLLCLCLSPMFTIDLLARDLGDIFIHESVEPPYLVLDRGKWSAGPYDSRIELTGEWNAVRSDGVDLGIVRLPFAWDGWKGRITLDHEFSIPDSLSGSSFRLAVEGASEYIAIAVNDAHLDTRRGDGLYFQIDLDARLLRFGNDKNVIRIVLDNRSRRRGSVPLRGGIFSRQRHGGIHQNIYIIVSPSIYISDISTEWIDRAGTVEDTLSIEIELYASPDQPPDSAAADRSITFQILNHSGELLIEKTRNISQLNIGGISKIRMSMPTDLLQMWDIFGSPRSYIIKSFLRNPEISHTISVKTGLRSLHFETTGFVLNGIKQQLRCINYIDLQPERDALIDVARLESDIRMIKDLGLHAVRIMQGSASMPFLDLCDKLGLLVFEELPVFQVPDPILIEPEFIRSASEQFEAMILRDRQFACIAAWGVGSQLNPPNQGNLEYFEKMSNIARRLDSRPVYAAFPFQNEINVAPLDLAIVEITSFYRENNNRLPGEIDCDKPVIIAATGITVSPGNLGGYADPSSEAGQADYLLKLVKKTEKLSSTLGVIIGEFSDWQGAVPYTASPQESVSHLYTTGISNAARNPRLAYHHLKEYWLSGRIQPLSAGTVPHRDGAIFIILGLGLTIILFIAARQNNIFRSNLGRTFTSMKIFFHDIGDRRRYNLTGQTLLVAFIVSGVISLIITGWLYSNRHSYPLAWVFGYLFGDSEILVFSNMLTRQPAKGLLFFWLIGGITILISSVRVSVLFKILGKNCSLSQGMAFVTWSMAGFLGLLPLGMLAERLFRASLGLPILLIVIVLMTWSYQRFIFVIAQNVKQSATVVTGLWFIGPIILFVSLYAGLEYTLQISDYWSFYVGTIIR